MGGKRPLYHAQVLTLAHQMPQESRRPNFLISSEIQARHRIGCIRDGPSDGPPFDKFVGYPYRVDSNAQNN
jgi:hypothetical protein